MEIEEIKVPTVKIWTIPNIQAPNVIATPSVPIPYIETPCSEVRRDYTRSKQIFTDDPAGNTVICPGIPWFEPIQYNPKKIQIIQSQKPTVEPPPTNTAETPEAEIPKDDLTQEKKENVPCPDPQKNNPRIGDIAANGKEKVSGFELSKDGQTCLVIYSPISVTEKYLPQIGTVSTTAIIASTAVVSSVLAKPIADLLLKVIKPSVKKVITTLKTKLLKKPPEKKSIFDKKMEQRERNKAIRKLKKGW